MKLNRATLGIVVLFVGTILLYFFPLLWGQVLLPSGTDLAIQYYPYFHFYTSALHAGESFLWVPYLYSGFPAYVSQVGGFLDPLNMLLGKLLLAPFMVELRLMFDILLTLFCAYAAARTLGISKLAAGLAGVAYLISFDWIYLSNPLTANTLFLLPLLLVCATKLLERRWSFVTLGGAGLGWALLCGYTQVILYAVVLAGVYFVSYAFLSRMSLKMFAGPTIAFVLMVGVGGVIGLPQLLPALKFLPQTSRAEASSYENITLKVLAPGDLLLSLVPPSFYVPYVTPGRKPLYVGALWLLLGVGALAVTATAWRRRNVLPEVSRIAAVGTAFLFAFIAAVQWSPLYYLLNTLPVFSLFRFPFRFMFLGTFLLAVLGAYGFDRAQELLRFRIFRIAAYGLAAVAALFIAGIVFVQTLGASGASALAKMLADLFNATVQGRLGFDKDASSYARAFEGGLGAYREHLSLFDLGILLPLLCLAASALIAVLFVRGKLVTVNFKFAAAVLGVATVASVGVGGWRAFSPPELYGYPSPFAARVAPDMSLYRVYPFLIGEAASAAIPPQYKLSVEEARASQALASAGETPNLNFIHGVHSVDGYDQFEPSVVLEAMGRIGGELGAGYGGGSVEDRKAALLGNLETLGMMGGKYIISGAPLASPSLVLLATSSVTDYRMTLYLYEYPKAFPRYFLAREGCMSCAPVNTPLPIKTGNGYYHFNLSLAKPATLVISETNLLGWAAIINGSEVPLRRVNELYMGVDVPAGEQRVVLEYRGMLNELYFLRAIGIVTAH